MPFCTHCAHELPAGARFCPACASAVAPTVAPAASGPPSPSLEVTRTSAGEAPLSPSLTSSSGAHGRFEPGTRLGSRYRIVGLLGRGGMGEVYRADDLELGQSVALKFLPDGVASSAAELTRFRGEVRLARQIAHPNVCRVYDIGEADGHVFLSMEYIDGEDLASVIRRMGRPSTDKALEIARQICLGLAAAHEAGMLHRDLKPANIMIDGRGRARITDFGLAALADDLVRDGRIAGTPAYMAPEQVAGGRLTARSDLFALGLVLYELFTGRRVFEAKTFADLKQAHEASSISLPSSIVRGLDPAVERVILHCLERDPDQRPASAYAVLGALPGGDPLAAALAAGETPSPELVANAGDRGGLAPPLALGLVAVGLAALATCAALLGPELRGLDQPDRVLAVRAADLLTRTGCFATLPAHTQSGFFVDRDAEKALRAKAPKGPRRPPRIVYWHRWSGEPLQPRNMHSSIVGVDSPPGLASGEATVMLDPSGRLVGLYAVPPDSLRTPAGAVPDWGLALAAAGLDTTKLEVVAPPGPAPAMCDSARAWRGRVGSDTVTVQAGASRGRIAHFAVIRPWGASTARLEPKPEGGGGGFAELLGFLLLSLLPFGASVAFGVRNIRLGRGDLRGASRIALFVFLATLSESVFTSRPGETGWLSLGWSLVNGRPTGHSWTHAMAMWFAYVALEPYLRKLWPGMLVSWSRLLTGRLRDPLVGRDALLGFAAGLGLQAAMIAVQALANRAGLSHATVLASDSLFDSLGGAAATASGFGYAASICILDTLETLVVLLLMRLLLRRTAAAGIAAVVLLALPQVLGVAGDLGWPLAIAIAVLSIGGAVTMLLRFGLLAAVATAFASLVSGYAVLTLSPLPWYADRVFLPVALLTGLMLAGAFTALAGKSILGDPLREE